jgi:hypothetical protein
MANGIRKSLIRVANNNQLTRSLNMPDKSLLRITVASVFTALLWVASGAQAAPGRTLTAFASEQEISDLFKRWAEENRRRGEARQRSQAYSDTASGPGMGALSAAPASAKAAEAAADSITNVQHAGVDEGGIVKRHGDYLVILRRGRLFTVKVGEELAPASVSDAFGNGISPSGAWYDEMLISGNTITVIGYSYERGGTEIGLFEISNAGRLSYKATYHLRSNDYYSSRNYASRLIGTKLVFYTPMHLNPWGGEPWGSFPAIESASRRPVSTPIPVGPRSLCPESTTKSAPSASTSSARCGAAWAASTRTAAPTSREAATSSRTG